MDWRIKGKTIKIGEKINHLTFLGRRGEFDGIFRCACGHTFKQRISVVFGPKRQKTCGADDCKYHQHLKRLGRLQGTEKSQKKNQEGEATKPMHIAAKGKKPAIKRQDPSKSNAVNIMINQRPIQIGAKKDHLTLLSTDLVERAQGGRKGMTQMGLFRCDCGVEVQIPLWRIYATRKHARTKTCQTPTCHFHLLDTKNPAVMGENAGHAETAPKLQVPEIEVVAQRVDRLKKDAASAVSKGKAVTASRTHRKPTDLLPLIPTRQKPRPVSGLTLPTSRTVVPVFDARNALETPLMSTPLHKLADLPVALSKKQEPPKDEVLPAPTKTVPAKEVRPRVKAQDEILALIEKHLPMASPSGLESPAAMNPEEMIQSQLRRLAEEQTRTSALTPEDATGLPALATVTLFDGWVLSTLDPITVLNEEGHITITCRGMRLDFHKEPR